MFQKKNDNNAILLDEMAWKSTFIKFTICQRIKLPISWFCCLEMLSEFKIISTAFLQLTSTKQLLYRSLVKAIGRVLLITTVRFDDHKKKTLKFGTIAQITFFAGIINEKGKGHTSFN